jgi:Protein of unknown function (DUF3667)/Domain of unknown function (DUF4286)
VAANLIYEVECQLDPDIVADYDAWLPGHVQEVLACAGFLGATIDSTETPPGERQRRRVRYSVESLAALDHYLENNATRLRTATAERFGDRIQCERRVFKPRGEVAPPGQQPANCLNCGTPLAGSHCVACGQAGDVHVLSMKEVAGDVTHSLLHLDSRVWRTIRLLASKPGELTREFIAGRHQLYIPPFRLYLAVSILFFALQALLPDSDSIEVESAGDTVDAPASAQVPKEVEAELKSRGIDLIGPNEAGAKSGPCNFSIFGDPRYDRLELSLRRACLQMREDRGARFAERFATTAPKLMFLFLPLMAAVALLFYWRPRRLYAEHLVLFLHNHAFVFLLLGTALILGAIGDLELPFVGILGFLSFLLYLYLFWYIYRSMRVVYGDGRFKTLLKYVVIGTTYLVLLGVTMLAGLLYTMIGLS